MGTGIYVVIGLARLTMSNEVLQSLQLIHTRLSKLEDKKKEAGRDEAFTALLKLPKWFHDHLEWETMKQDFIMKSQLLGVEVFSTSQINEFVRNYNMYWTDVTGKDIKFRYGNAHVKQLTLPEAALRRNVELRGYFKYRPTIFEAYPGCGGDTITFLYNFDPKAIYASDLTQKYEPNYIRNNVIKFQQQFPETKKTKVILFNKRASDFLLELSEQQGGEEQSDEHVHVDMLYLDPPWTLDGMDREMTAEEMMDYLSKEIFDPIYERGFTPKLIVLKARFDWKSMRGLMSKLPGYLHVDTMNFSPLRREVRFHIMLSTRYTVSTWHESAESKYCFKGGPEPSFPRGDPRRAENYGSITYERSERQ
jgi:hypothetical protein